MAMRYFSLNSKYRPDVRKWLIEHVGPKKFHMHNDWEGGEGWSIGNRSNTSPKEYFNVAVDERIATYLILRFS
jgi:hypothetical protein